MQYNDGTESNPICVGLSEAVAHANGHLTGSNESTITVRSHTNAATHVDWDGIESQLYNIESLESLVECHGLDTPERIFFYEHEYYVFSNFSCFEVRWGDITFKSSEHLYHYLRFILSDKPGAHAVALKVFNAPSAHEAYRIAQENKHLQVDNWDEIKEDQMRMVIRLKRDQHEYVARKLTQSKGRLLIENSWRDSYWGSGPDGLGLNVLGRLWMELRDED